MNPTLTLALAGGETGEVGDHIRPNEIDFVPACILDVLEPLCARGFLRQATRLCLVSKTVAAALPMGTGRQLYDAVVAGREEELTVYLEYWRGNCDGPNVLNWEPPDNEGEISDMGDWFTNFPESPLVVAAQSENLACMELLLSFTPALDVNKGDCTALHYMCSAGLDRMVRLLLAAPGIDINKANFYNSTPLHLAAQQGHAEVVRLLVAARGIKVDVTNRDWDTPLALAKGGRHHAGCQEVIAILTEGLKKKKVFDAAGERVYNTAADYGILGLGPLLKKWSGNEDVLNWEHPEGGGTAIYNASVSGDLEVVKLLASTPGVDVNKISDHGTSPLMDAVRFCNVDVVRFLLTVEGINISVKSPTTRREKGKSALGLAMERGARDDDAMWGAKQEIAAMLRAAGAQEDEI